MNCQMSVVMRVVAESLAASVTCVDAHRVSAKEVDVTHVPHQPLACEEGTVADLALEVARQHVRRFVLHQSGAVQRAELAVAAVVRSLPVWILRAVETDVLAQIPIEYTTVWTDTLKCNNKIDINIHTTIDTPCFSLIDLLHCLLALGTGGTECMQAECQMSSINLHVAG